MRVDFLFAVHVSGGAGKLQQLVGLVHHQGRVELAQFQQVAAENPTEAQRVKRVRGRRKGSSRGKRVCLCVPVYLFAVNRDVEEEAASLQNHRNQMCQQLSFSYLVEVTVVNLPSLCMLICY